MLDAYEVTGNKAALARGLDIIGFAEKNYRTQDGIFRLEGGADGAIEDWLWRYEDVKEWLSDTEFAAWDLASGMRAAGNLPSEADPMREFFRANSISSAKTPEEVAAILGTDVAITRETLDRVKAKLLKVRTSRLKAAPEDQIGNAVATFRMVSAYAAAYRITGEESFRERAVATLTKARRAFSDGSRLKSYDSDAAASLIAGRAFVYGLAVQAALDVAAVTLDDTWVIWAGDVSSTASEIFVQNNSFRECSADADLMGLPIIDSSMLFDESSVGLFSMADARLDSLGIPLIPSFAKLVDDLPADSVDRPILYTDVIQATLMREYGVSYVFGDQISGEMRERISRSPLKGISRRASSTMPAKDASPDPTGVLIIESNKKSRRVGIVEDMPVPFLP